MHERPRQPDLTSTGLSSLRRTLLHLQRLIQTLRQPRGTRQARVLDNAQAEVAAVEAEILHRQDHPVARASDS